MDLEYEQQRAEPLPNALKRNKDKKRKRAIVFLKVIVFLLSVAIWAALVYGGYYVANTFIEDSKNYVDQRIGEVKELNHQQLEQLIYDIKDVQVEIANIESELTIIQNDLKLTEEVITGADKTKLSLQQNIVELNKRLDQLRVAISRLEDASRD